MARPKKAGFDTFELPVDFFTDPRIVEMSRRLGSASLAVVLSIYAETYRLFGYYLPATEAAYGLVGGDANTTDQFAKEVIEETVRCGLFDVEKYREHNILTSKEIQTAYMQKVKSSRRVVKIQPEYSLLDAPEKKTSEPAELSGMIVGEWNRLNSVRPENTVSEGLGNDPVFLESIRNITEHYADMDSMVPWFDILRNAFVEQSELSLCRIVSHEPTFRMLYNMGEPAEFIPGVCSPPLNGIHPALTQEARMKRSGYSPEEIDEVTRNLIERETPPAPSPSPEPVSEDFRCQIISAYDETERAPNVVSVYVANEAPAESADPAGTIPTEHRSYENFFANRSDTIEIDGEIIGEPEPEPEPEEPEENPAGECSGGVHENDPELSPLLRRVIRTFNEKQREAGYPEEYQLDESLSEDGDTIGYMRKFIESDERCRDPEFWSLLIDGVIYLHKFRPRVTPDHPGFLFCREYPEGYSYPLEDRVKLLWRYRMYVTDPSVLSDSIARETGPGFIEMKRREKCLESAPEKTEEPKKETPEEPTYPEGITEDQKLLLDALRSNPDIPKGDMGWLQDRILHPEEFKDPDKPYGDRTPPMPYAKKNPPDYETLKEDPNYCRDLAHGSTIRMR